MKLSLSVRVAESLSSKRTPTMPLKALAELASAQGYHALCMRASQLGVDTPNDLVRRGRNMLDDTGLKVSMVTGDFAIPENTDEGPAALRNITPHLDLAEALGSDMVRIAMKRTEDIASVRRAADEANERRIRLVHMCHTQSLCERVAETLEVVKRVNRMNFGIVYEPANLALCGEPYGPEAIDALAPYTFNVYLQNLRIKADGADTGSSWSRGKVRFDQIPLWQGGGINFPLALTTLEKSGYDGYVTVHQAFAGLSDVPEAVQRSALYLKSIVAFEG